MELYGQLTSSLNQLFASQLTEAVQWRNVPGTMSRISSSPSGYTWGLNEQTLLFSCVEPCAGQWNLVPLEGQRIVDLTTDAQNVYVLTLDGQVLSRPVNGSGSWSAAVQAPMGATTLAATGDALWADTPRGPFQCALPCTTGNWVGVSKPATLTGTTTGFMMSGPQGGPLTGSASQRLLQMDWSVPPESTVKLTSASARRAYGVSGALQAKMYENGAWKDIPGFAGRQVTSVAGEMDDRAIYATSSQGEILRCGAPCAQPSDVQVLSTNGHGPQTTGIKQVSASPKSELLWQISSAPGDKGNLFTKAEGDFSTALASASLLDSQRDDIVRKLGVSYEEKRAKEQAGQRIEDTTDAVRNSRPRRDPEDDPRVMRRLVDQPPLAVSIRVVQIALGTVLICLILYLAIPAPWVHGMAFLTACAGTALAISFSAVQR